MRNKFFITTPIYYVNDIPHIGHAYTTVAADILARYNRVKGKKVFFLTGADEHGQKVEKAAQEKSRSPKEHADLMVENYKTLWSKLDIKNDVFIRTTDSEHVKTVQSLLQKLWEKGEIEKRLYSGWYCIPDERFWTDKEVVTGNCPDCKRPVERITEENYFFLMSKYQERLLKYIDENPYYILPETRKNEVLGFLKNNPLGDLCISRPKHRLSWGISLPFDDSFVTYVWFDALINYYSATKYLAPEHRVQDTAPPTQPSPSRGEGKGGGEVSRASKLPKIAIMREEGSNGDREMTSAFYQAGFEVWDITMTDLLEVRANLEDFRGIAFVGGFSYADVLDSAKGWAGVIRFNKRLYEQFHRFYERPDTFSLGVCNGCQLMALLGWVPWKGIPDKIQPRYIQNKSGRFESRFSTVHILPSPSIMLRGMEGSTLGVWVAHGEGRLYFPEKDMLQEVIEKNLVPIRFVDDNGEITETYPFNPNGSPLGITALCSPDGRHLAMMPHPERTFLKWQWPYMPEDWKKTLKASPWLKMFQNAREWCAGGGAGNRTPDTADMSRML